MDQGRDDLWRGGPWEQPSPVFTPPPEVVVPPRKKKKVRRRGRIFLFAAMLTSICALTLVLAFVGRHWGEERERKGWDDPASMMDSHQLPEQTIPSAPTGTGVTLTILPRPDQVLSYGQVYEKNLNSIVTVHAIDQHGMGQGTGIVMTQDGYIITNAHVIQNAGTAAVVLNDDSVYQAALVGSSWEEDLAVLKIDAQGLTPAEFGDSSLMKVGDMVSALGSPLGYRMTLTSGIISAVDRELQMDGVSMYLLQTNAAINFGNSGGALFNDRGQVVGVTTAKIVAEDGSTEALGFAIPTERVKYVVDHLIAGEEIRVPALGITVQYDPKVTGLTVIEIQPWSDAVAQGLAVGDVIDTVNGQPVRINRDLERIKNLQRIGDKLHLEVYRNGKALVFDVELQDWVALYGEDS